MTEQTFQIERDFTRIFVDLARSQNETLALPLLLKGLNVNKGDFMKQVMMILLLALSTSSAFAWKETAPVQKEYTFKFDPQHKLSSQPYEVRKLAASYEDAFDSAAQQCFRYYKGAGKVSEDRGLDIIDICANPRS